MDFTTIKKDFWHDSEIMSWTPEQKYFYLYLLTNPRVTWCGIFPAPLRLMEAETGYNWETIRRLIAEAETAGKITWSEETREIAVRNWLKYHRADNANVKKAIIQSASKVKSKTLFSCVDGLYDLGVSGGLPEGSETQGKPLPEGYQGVTPGFGSIEKEKEIEKKNTISPTTDLVWVNHPDAPPAGKPVVDELYKPIEQAFLSKVGTFATYQREGVCIKAIIKAVRNLAPNQPQEAAMALLEKYWDLTHSVDKFWRNQPFTPSGLSPQIERVWLQVKAGFVASRELDEVFQ